MAPCFYEIIDSSLISDISYILFADTALAPGQRAAADIKCLQNIAALHAVIEAFEHVLLLCRQPHLFHDAVCLGIVCATVVKAVHGIGNVLRVVRDIELPRPAHFQTVCRNAAVHIAEAGAADGDGLAVLPGSVSV